MVTTNMLTIMKRKNLPEDQASEKRMMRERSKKMIDDFKQTYTQTTEARHANAHIEFKPDIAPKPMTGRMDPLPKWHRLVTRMCLLLCAANFIFTIIIRV